MGNVAGACCEVEEAGVFKAGDDLFGESIGGNGHVGGVVG